MLPQLVLVSSAARTRETYEFMKSQWPNGIAVKFIDELYEASADTLLTVILKNCGVHSNVAVIGHNPSLVILLNHMILIIIMPHLTVGLLNTTCPIFPLVVLLILASSHV